MFGTFGRSSLKVMLRMVGIDCGPVCPSIDPATPEQVTALRKRLDEMDWFDWIDQNVSVSA